MFRLGVWLGVVAFLGFAAEYPVWPAEPHEQADAGIIRKLEGHGSEVVSVAFSGSGREVHSASNDGQVHVWDVATGKQMRRFQLKLETELSRFRPRFPGRGQDTFILIAPGGRYAAAAWNHRSFRLFELRSGEEVCDFGQFFVHDLAMAFSPDGSLLAASYPDRKGDRVSIQIWEVDSGKKVHQWTRPGMVTALAFSPDGKVLACGDHKQADTNMESISLLDLSTGKERRRFQTTASGPLAFDGKRVALRTENSLQLWDVSEGTQTISVPCKFPLGSVIFSPDGRSLAFAGGSSEGNEGVIQLCEVATGKIRREFVGQLRFASPLALSPDGKVLASGIEKTVVLWDVFGKAR